MRKGVAVSCTWPFELDTRFAGTRNGCVYVHVCCMCMCVCVHVEDSEYVRPVRSIVLTRVTGVLSGIDITIPYWLLFMGFFSAWSRTGFGLALPSLSRWMW